MNINSPRSFFNFDHSNVVSKKTQLNTGENQNVSTHQLSDDQKKFLDNFVAVYDKLFESLNELKLDNKEIREKLSSLISLSENTEINIDLVVNQDFIEKLKTINEGLKNQHSEENNKFTKQIINDLILFSSLVPSKITTSNFLSKDHLQRKTINVLSPLMAHHIIDSLASQKTVDFLMNSNLNYLNPIEYSHLTVPQKMLMLNLANFEPEFRQKIMDNPCFKMIKDKENLVEWMFNCSGSLEQKYLNTCVCACFCEDILSRVAILPEALLLSRQMLDQIKSRIDEINDPSTKEYVEHRLIKLNHSLEKIENKILNEPHMSSDEIYKLTLKWSQSFEKLGLLISPTTTPHPTPKIIGNHWLLSAAIMTPVVLLEHLFHDAKNPPKMEMRLFGTNWDNLMDAIQNSVISPSYHGIGDREKDILLGHITDCTEAEKDLTLMKLWTLTNMKGGIPIQIPGHLMYLKAINYQDVSTFILSDPKQNDYQLLSFRQLLDYIKTHKAIFSL